MSTATAARPSAQASGLLLSPAEARMFWSVERRAWTTYAAGVGISSADNDEHTAWRREQISLATGGLHSSAKTISGGAVLDSVLLHFAIVANDDALIGRFTAGAERRVRWLIQSNLRLLAWVTGNAAPWTYAQSIFLQMRLPDTVEDCPADLARQVLAALDTHLRRFFSDAGCRPVDARRAHALGAPWISSKIDRENNRVWMEAIDANRDRRDHKKYDHQNTPQKRHADTP